MKIKPKKIIRVRRRTLSLQINENGELIVRVPKYISDALINQFIEKHEKWIDEKVNEMLQKKSRIPIYNFIDGEEYLFLGNKYKLKIENFETSHKSKIKIENQFLLVSSNDKKSIPKLIEKFYKEEFRKIIQQRVDYFLPKFNELMNSSFSYQKIKISSGRKNIGSCSAKGNLNFSWRLVQAPLDVIDYVVVHEIVHLKEKNHNKAFWRKVKSLKPNYKENLNWIKENWFFLRDFLRKQNQPRLIN
ncbi:MAG: M48 family metallopeptidase [Ignavibacteria bacterium]|nr:M48 family metallopeptidase [Ignavibacteria bacterium]